MPQSAATMLGLILVAASIGFNMTHWPDVGRTVAQAATPTRSDETVDAAPEPEAVDSVPSPELPVPATVVPEVMPNDPQPARAMEMREEPVHATVPAAVPAAVPAEEEMPAAMVREKPLVPIPPLRNPSMPRVMDLSDHTVRRLPPVDDPRPAYLPGNDAVVGNNIPIYPSTGVE